MSLIDDTVEIDIRDPLSISLVNNKTTNKSWNNYRPLKYKWYHKLFCCIMYD